MKFEKWRGIKGFIGYCVSDRGRVYSSKSGKILKPLLQGGYICVVLSREGIRHNKTVHRMVLEAFYGQCPDGSESCHGPGGRLDNSLENLSWGTKAKNNGPDKIRDGVMNRGERQGHSKLKEKDALEIFNSSRTYSELSNMFNISIASVCDIKRKRTWGWLTCPT